MDESVLVIPSKHNSIFAIPGNKHFIEYFLEIKALKCVATAKRYKKSIEGFFKVTNVTLISIDDIKQVTIMDCEQWIKEMIERGLAPNTVNSKVAALSSLYKWLLRYTDNYTSFELIRFNPFGSMQDIKPKIIQVRDTEFLSARETNRLLASIKTDTILGLRNKTIIYMFVTTALRKSELTKIKIKDITTFNGFDIAKILGKGNKPDVVKLQPKLVMLIKDYLDRTNRSVENNKDEYLFNGESSNKLNGAKLSTTALNKMLIRVSKNAHINKVLSIHSLRHTAITIAISSGCTIEKVRDFARHKNIATTNIYIHSINKIKDNAGDSVANLINI